MGCRQEGRSERALGFRRHYLAAVELWFALAIFWQSIRISAVLQQIPHLRDSTASDRVNQAAVVFFRTVLLAWAVKAIVLVHLT